MADKKAELHNVNLRTTDVCLNRFNHDIKPYEGFRRNNSPFYGNLLSPFYSKKYRAVSSESYITKNGTIFTIENGSLKTITNTGDEVTLNDTSSTQYVTREEKRISGSETYQNIIGIFSDMKMLCTSSEGKMAIINTDGTTLYSWNTETYYPGEKVHFIESGGSSYCWAISDVIYIVDSSGNIFKKVVSTSRTNQPSYGCTFSNGHYIICRFLGNSSYLYTANVNGAFTDVGTIQMKHGNSTETFTGSTWNLFMNRNGKTVHTTNTFNYNDGLNYKIFECGYDAEYISDGVIQITVNENQYQETSDLAHDTYEMLSKTFDNNCCIAVIGHKTEGYVRQLPGEWTVVTIPIVTTTYTTISIPDGLGGTIVQVVPVSTVTGYQTIPTYVSGGTENVPGSYYVKMIDGNFSKVYNTVPIGVNGEYPAGQISPLGNNMRILYHNGTAQSVSICKDDNTVGTLVCGMQEINTDYPISYFSYGTDTIMCYHDTKSWQIVRLTSDSTKATMKVINEQYILLNISDYYNCYDTVGNEWHHFASDWNDRAVFKCTGYSFDTVPTTFSEYLSKCDAYYFASGQGAKFELLDTPFISSLFPAYGAVLPKSYSSIDTVLVAGYTPDNSDVDLFYDKSASSGNYPLYRYSMDGDVKYVNEVLVGTYYDLSFTLIPSLFATFINGFINQGIIIDNGHSYLQVYANKTKPIFAISFVSQLEGVTGAFIIQGQYFVIINGSIYKYYNDQTPVEAVVRIDEMELVGYSPYMAIFWSAANKTFYSFTGDNIMQPLVQADEIGTIRSSGFNPNTLSIYVVTDVSVLILAQDYLVKLESNDYNKVFPLSYGCALSSESETVLLSYNKMEGYDVLPIELETELYGYGNSIKSVNDCVYIRLFCEEHLKGTVEISSETLNEGSFMSGKETKTITPEMWDKNSHTVFIRYQPKYQAATGFSVRIKSPFAIVSVQISSKIETVQNSSINI